VKKANELEPSEKPPASFLSGNKVTGFSVNFPIANTCRPSKVCIETCYYAVGATAWDNSLRKQLWLMQHCIENPVQFAEEIVAEYRKKKLEYLRWNGGGSFGLLQGFPKWPLWSVITNRFIFILALISILWNGVKRRLKSLKDPFSFRINVRKKKNPMLKI
jgi:hypothetical protein